MIAPNTLHMFAARVIADTDSDDTATVVRAVIDAILDRYVVVDLPEATDEDDDGQRYLGLNDFIRVDMTGQHGPEVYIGKVEMAAWELISDAAHRLAAARLLENGTSR